MFMRLRYIDKCTVRNGAELSLAVDDSGLARTIVCLEIDIDRPIVKNRAMLECAATFTWYLGWQAIPGGWLLNLVAGDAACADTLRGYFSPINEEFVRDFLDAAMRSGNIIVRVRGLMKQDGSAVEITGAVQPDGISINSEESEPVERILMWQRRN